MRKRKQEDWRYRLIDGNWAKEPVAYCTYHHGCLTEALMKVHKCKERECARLKTDIDLEKDSREVER